MQLQFRTVVRLRSGERARRGKLSLLPDAGGRASAVHRGRVRACFGHWNGRFGDRCEEVLRKMAGMVAAGRRGVVPVRAVGRRALDGASAVLVVDRRGRADRARPEDIGQEKQQQETH